MVLDDHIKLLFQKNGRSESYAFFPDMSKEWLGSAGETPHQPPLEGLLLNPITQNITWNNNKQPVCAFSGSLIFSRSGSVFLSAEVYQAKSHKLDSG